MESIVRWVNGLQFEGTFSTGRSVLMDTSPEQGGNNDGPRPVELLLAGLGGCTGMDVLAILRKKRQKVSAFRVHVRGDRRETHPRVFTKIHVVYEVIGQGIDIEAVRQAIHLSEEKYCSVAAMLRCAAPITAEIQVQEEAR
jgi:putative redox protein